MPMDRKQASWVSVYVVLVVLLGFRLLAGPALIDRVYGRGLYPVTQQMQGLVFGWWPISASLVGSALLVIAIVSIVGLAARREPSFVGKLRRIAVGVANLLVLVITWFLLCWGINYGRPTVPMRMGLGPFRGGVSGDASPDERVLLPTEILERELIEATELVNRLRDSGGFPVQRAVNPFAEDDAVALGSLLRETLRDIGTTTVPVRRLRILPAGTLLRFGTAGVFSPWTGDPHVDGGLHALQMPFTATHELAHAQGVTDEGDCNLLAYLAARRSPDAYVRYSAELTYLRYLRSAVARRDRARFTAISAGLSPTVVADLREIQVAMDRYTEIAPAARDYIYDSYLKTQGVHEGLASYGRLIDWVVEAKRVRPEFFREAQAAAPAR